jgi:hypothetical protein
LISNLYAQGAIREQKFALGLRGPYYYSTADFGFFNPYMMSNSSKVAWIPVLPAG